MPRAASVWLDVLPSMAEFRRELRQQLEEPVRQSATRAGEQGGQSLMAGLGGKMKAGALAAGVAAGALVAKGVALELEKAAASGKLKASLGLSPKEAQKAGNAAGKLYANAVTESIDEGADAVKAIMSAGLAPEKATTKQLANIATKAQDLSKLFEVDLGQAANAAGQAVKTGLAKNADEAFDSMFRGFQVMGPRADDLADTFNEYSTIFRSLNLPIKTVTGLLAQGMANGARDTDVVADALKEFQIRATDGSTASAAGFKALGLSAKGMTSQIAKGGKGASDGLQTVLDRLRKMKDPVDRNAAAVALFGTKAEDMGQALYSLDPSKAESALGKVGGAAKQAGDDLRDNAGVKFEQFKRRFLMTIGDATARYALPALMKFGTFLINDVLPPVQTVTGWLGDHFGPAIRAVGDVISSTVDWFKKWGIWLTPLAILIGGITLALSAQAIVTGTVIGVMTAYSLASRGIALVTQGWAAAQALLNAVMALNPFVLVAIAVVALGAALVIAWKKSQTFRDIVLGAWSAIQAGAMWLWTNGIKPMVDGFMTGLRAVGKWASWLWTTVLSPTFSVIATGAKILATILAIVVFGPIYLGVKVLGAIFTWLWSNVIQPVFGWIVAAAQLWWTGVKLYFSLVMAGLRTVGGWFKWLYTNAVKPVIGWIVAGASALWTGVQIIFGYFMTGLKTIGGWFKWLWQKAVAPAFSGIKSVMSTIYEGGIKPVFNALKSAVGKLGDAFEAGQKAIKRAWDKVSGIAKAPIKFVIDTVYNGGIVPVWNKVAKAFGAPQLKEFHPKGFARGGMLPGQSSYRGGDDQLVPMRRGEGVYVSEAMRDPYERARLFAVNKAAMRGQSLSPFQSGGYAEGGIFGWIGKAGSALKGAGSDVWNGVKKGASWLKDTLAASARAGVNHVVEPLLKQIPGLDTGFGKMVASLPRKAVDALFGYADQADKKGASTSFKGGKIPTGQHRAIISQALAAAGVPPPGAVGQWLSGMNTLITRESAWNASAVNNWDSNAKAGHPSQGLTQTIPSTWAAHVPASLKSRGILDPVGNVAASIRYIVSRYGNIANVQQADASKAPKGYAKGGNPRAGELAWVGEMGPELVRFRGGEQVFNHRDSMRMWEGLGARGFAKGTTAAKARKDIPGDLTNFTKSLKGSAADISKAAKELAADLKAAGGSGKSLAAQVTKVSAKLQSMAKQRDAINNKIAAAKSAAADQKKTAQDYLGLSNLSDATSISDVLGGMSARQNSLSGFESTIAGLSKKGLSQDLISQLEAMGPDSSLAGVIAGANPAQINQLNAMAKNGAKLSTSYGNTMADAMYDAGKSASKGFLTGLMADEKALQAAMAKIGSDAVKAIRSKKGIDAHSPSRKGARAGADLGAGLVAGMTAAGPSIESAAARMGASAVPAGVVPVTSAASSQTASGGLNGQPLYLVVEDGTVLRAYVSDRVDDALTDVRRSKRSGKK